MKEHVDLLDPELHEPKGVAAATVDKVYVADGAGSGTWKTSYVGGVEDHADDTTGAQALTSGVFLDVANDGAGANSISTHRLPGKDSLYDAVNDELDFSSYSLGDTLIVRVSTDLIAGAVNTVFTVAIEFGLTAFTYELDTDPIYFKSAGTYPNVVNYFTFDLQDGNTRDNPAKVKVKADSSGSSVIVNGYRFFAQPKNPVYD